MTEEVLTDKLSEIEHEGKITVTILGRDPVVVDLPDGGTLDDYAREAALRSTGLPEEYITQYSKVECLHITEEDGMTRLLATIRGVPNEKPCYIVLIDTELHEPMSALPLYGCSNTTEMTKAAKAATVRFPNYNIGLVEEILRVRDGKLVALGREVEAK